MSTAAIDHRVVLADLVPRSAVRTLALVGGAILLTAASARLTVPLPFTPVPVSGQTLAVLLTAAALGPLRAVAAQGGYVLLGLIGLPFFADGASGVEYVFGATGGYLFGFVVAAWFVGSRARRGDDRSPWRTIAAFAGGSVLIYAFGVPWLAVAADISLGQAVSLGVVPFLIGDVLKAALAGGLLPFVWRLIERSRS